MHILGLICMLKRDLLSSKCMSCVYFQLFVYMNMLNLSLLFTRYTVPTHSSVVQSQVGISTTVLKQSLMMIAMITNSMVFVLSLETVKLHIYRLICLETTTSHIC